MTFVIQLVFNIPIFQKLQETDYQHIEKTLLFKIHQSKTLMFWCKMGPCPFWAWFLRYYHILRCWSIVISLFSLFTNINLSDTETRSHCLMWYMLSCRISRNNRRFPKKIVWHWTWACGDIAKAKVFIGLQLLSFLSFASTVLHMSTTSSYNAMKCISVTKLISINILNS